jgi:hypothetical protein
MIFIETSAFSKLLPTYLTDEDYRGLQTWLLEAPDAGKLIPGHLLKQIAEAIKNE